ncbi:MAG: hypothetical protein ACO1RX_20450 [Candidatus Sericytochromatia bacterium]
MQISSISPSINRVFASKPSLLAADEADTGPNISVDTFFTRTIFSGIMGKNMAKVHFNQGSPPGTSSIDTITQNAYLRQTAKSVGIGAGLYAGLSVLHQGIVLAYGYQDARGAAANILTETMRGGATGLGAAAGGGLTGMAMRAVGATGFFGTVMSFIGGAVGGTIGGNLVESTGIRQKLVTAFGSKPTYPAPPTAPAQPPQ